MLLLLTADAEPEELNDGGDDGLHEKALLDTEELREFDAFSVAPSDKVELDLDDAPFLEDDDEEEEETYEEEAPTELMTATTEAAPFYKERLFILIAAGVILLLLIIILLIVFWPDSRTVDIPPEELDGTVQEEVVEELPPFVWDPFVVELRDHDGKIRFLYIKIAAPVDSELLQKELSHLKLMKIRDAVYYYLKNKDISYLDDKENEETLKRNLLTVINQLLSHGTLEEIYILEYLVK